MDKPKNASACALRLAWSEDVMAAELCPDCGHPQAGVSYTGAMQCGSLNTKMNDYCTSAPT